MVVETAPKLSRQPTEDLNPFHVAQRQFDQAVRLMPEVDAGLAAFLRRPAKSIILEFPIETDSGAVEMFVGYRVLHSNVRGPGKGGIRFHPDVTLDEVRASAPRHRSPVVLQCVLDHHAGRRYPLALVHTDASAMYPTR